MGWTLAIVRMVREGLSDEEMPEQELEGSERGHAGAEGMAGCAKGCSGENKGPVCLGGLGQVVGEETQVSMRGEGGGGGMRGGGRQGGSIAYRPRKGL